MPTTTLKNGMFSWTDLSTPDVDGAKSFYTSLFGWSADDQPAGEFGTYTMFSRNGSTTAGLGSQPPEERAQGVPPHWSSYVLVEDVDATTTRAGELGGTVLLEPMDVMDAGRMAIIQDPTGAQLSLWEARGHEGATLRGEPGTMTWNELATRDAAAAADFYGGLLGWEYETTETHGTTYRMILVDGAPQGGILQMNEEWPEGVPPHWMVYFEVEDVADAARRVESLGGGVQVSPTDIDVGMMSVVSDPTGGHFTLFTPAAGHRSG